jgi:hypothetical protein
VVTYPGTSEKSGVSPTLIAPVGAPCCVVLVSSLQNIYGGYRCALAEMCGQIGMSVRQSAYSDHLNREQDLTAQGGKVFIAIAQLPSRLQSQ